MNPIHKGASNNVPQMSAPTRGIPNMFMDMMPGSEYCRLSHVDHWGDQGSEGMGRKGIIMIMMQHGGAAKGKSKRNALTTPRTKSNTKMHTQIRKNMRATPISDRNKAQK